MFLNYSWQAARVANNKMELTSVYGQKKVIGKWLNNAKCQKQWIDNALWLAVMAVKYVHLALTESENASLLFILGIWNKQAFVQGKGG